MPCVKARRNVENDALIDTDPEHNLILCSGAGAPAFDPINYEPLRIVPIKEEEQQRYEEPETLPAAEVPEVQSEACPPDGAPEIGTKVEEGTKMDGQKQTIYPRKNWSSMVLWNCGHPSNKVVTQKLVNDPTVTGAYLHRFSWLKDEEVGSIDHTWNYLVGVYDDKANPNLIHYTEGGPWFENYRDCEYHAEWKTELYNMMEDEV